MELERRHKPRLYDPIPVKVRGAGPDGKRFEFDTIAKDISAGGLCAPAPGIIRAGEELTFHIRFSLAPGRQTQAPTVSARGTVLRSEEMPDGSSRFAVAFNLRRVL
ncbi:MAG TPA: PilZ domain-containing protein [Acidobacteriota bacterium]|nr:PilZ domain-containing protein [Acidobacteriota bacterium]